MLGFLADTWGDVDIEVALTEKYQRRGYIDQLTDPVPQIRRSYPAVWEYPTLVMLLQMNTELTTRP